jgi:hypothetical protein
MISSAQFRMQKFAHVGVLVALAALAGCGGGDASSTAAKTPDAAATKPAAKAPAKQAAKPGATEAAKQAPAPTAQDASPDDPAVLAAIKDVALPTQAQADAAAAQAITDANADAEFEKLQKELAGTETPPK